MMDLSPTVTASPMTTEFKSPRTIAPYHIELLAPIVTFPITVDVVDTNAPLTIGDFVLNFTALKEGFTK